MTNEMSAESTSMKQRGYKIDPFLAFGFGTWMRKVFARGAATLNAPFEKSFAAARIEAECGPNIIFLSVLAGIVEQIVLFPFLKAPV